MTQKNSVEKLCDAEPTKISKWEDIQHLRRGRTWHGGAWADTCKIEATLKVVTPILGGSYKLRHIDDVDIIRLPSVRAHLRFWWRALYAHKFETAAALYKDETALWGGAADETGGRSAVEIALAKPPIEGKPDNAPFDLKMPGAYALWPAREPHAPRRKPGTTFELKLTAPKDCEAILRNVLRAWILLGGYGSRTRRGLGSLTVVKGDRGCDWLLEGPTAASIEELFGKDIFMAEEGTAKVSGPFEAPRLAGARLFIGDDASIGGDAEAAWLEALGWLRDFRQGTGDSIPARRRGPGRSNWPEADKIRHQSGPGPWAHPPEHNTTPAFPRGGFGLPIVGKFKPPREPGQFDIRWISGRGETVKQHDRLASPLIVKALPLANNEYVPCALWLNRDLPSIAKVGLAKPIGGASNDRAVDPRQAASFDTLIAPGDKVFFKPLSGNASLKDAFLDWLANTSRATEIAE